MFGAKTYIKIVGFICLLLIVQHLARVIYILGYHVTVYNHTPGPCRLVPGVDQGSEDMETLPNGLTFITSGLMWSLASTEFAKRYRDNHHRGKILLFDFNFPDNGVTELGFEGKFDQSTFHPHGISVLQNETTGTITVFVVNHPPGGDTIEKFEFNAERQALVHIKSYKDPLIRVANDVAATSEDSFYFTNYGYYQNPFLHWLHCVLLLRWGSIGYYNGEGYQTVYDGLLLPNGILLSKDKRTVYLASSLRLSVTIYHREVNDVLTFGQEFPLYAGPDNLLLEPKTGNILIGAHPVTHRVAEHLEYPITAKLPSPSKVLMLEMTNASHAASITELYSDDGSRLSVSTVASIYQNKMLIGTIFDKLMYCEVRNL